MTYFSTIINTVSKTLIKLSVIDVHGSILSKEVESMSQADFMLTARIIDHIGFVDGFAGNSENPNMKTLDYYEGMERDHLLMVYKCGYAKGAIRKYEMDHSREVKK